MCLEVIRELNKHGKCSEIIHLHSFISINLQTFFLHLEQFAFSEEIILFLANRKLLRKRKVDKGLLGK